jgi:hypothetical protein
MIPSCINICIVCPDEVPESYLKLLLLRLLKLIKFVEPMYLSFE